MLSPALAAQWRATQQTGPADAAPASRPAAARLGAPPALGEGEHVPMPGETSFGEFLSALNPLQHLPGIGTIYRAVTGDTIAPVYRVVGGFLMGGPVGAIASAVGALAEAIWETSGTPAEAPAATPAIASAAPAAPTATSTPVAPAAEAAPRAAWAPSAGLGGRAATTSEQAVDAEDRLRRLRAATATYARDVQAPLQALAEARGLAVRPTAGQPVVAQP